MESGVCITGIGVISPVGTGVNCFWKALKEKINGLGNLELADLSDFNGMKAGQITNFELSDYVKEKGLRYYSRAMGFVSAASNLALDDGNYCINTEHEDTTGIVLGSSFGNVESIKNFYQEALEEGARYVNPMMYPRTMMTIPASQICINHKIKGINRTFSHGAVCGMDSICYAAELIQNQEYSVMLAGGVEELNSVVMAKQMYCNGESQKAAPGEGSGMVLLENTQAAIVRRADIYAEIIGWSHLYNCEGNKEEVVYETIKSCMERAIVDAAVSPEEIGTVFMQSVPGSMPYSAEIRAIEQVLGDKKGIQLFTIQSYTGDCMGASSAMQVCAGAYKLQEDKKEKFVLCNAFTSDAAYTTVILKGMSR